MAGVQRLDMTGVQKTVHDTVRCTNIGCAMDRYANIEHIYFLIPKTRCVKIGQDTDIHTNIRCETNRCANTEPDTNSHGTTIKPSEITHCK